jgi:hypothetical protein
MRRGPIVFSMDVGLPYVFGKHGHDYELMDLALTLGYTFR